MIHGIEAAGGNGSARMLLSTLALPSSGSLPPVPATSTRFFAVAVSPVTKQVGACLGSSAPSSSSPEPASAFNCFQSAPSLEYQTSAWLAPYLTTNPAVLFQSVGAYPPASHTISSPSVATHGHMRPDHSASLAFCVQLTPSG